MVIRLGTGPWVMFGISVVFPFSLSPSTLRAAMCGLSPRLKFAVHMQAFMIVQMIRMMVITAKVVSDFRTARYLSLFAR